MDNLYREAILDHYKNPRNFGQLIKPDYTCSLYNSACGDRINIDIRIRNPASPADRQESGIKRIDEIRFTGEGCAISIASASMLTEKVIGKTFTQVEKINTSDIINMLGIHPSPTRLKCALLPLEVLHKVLSLAKIKSDGL
jgi:nitrogen fixation NifU-like protein